MDVAVRFRKRGSKYGLVTDKGRIVVPFVFDEVLPFCWGYGVGRVKGFGDYIYDIRGRLVIGQAVDKVSRYGFPSDEDAGFDESAHYIVFHKGKSCMLNPQMQVVIPWGEHCVEGGPTEGLWLIRHRRLCSYGFAGLGRVVVPCQYENARPFGNGYAVVRWRDGKYGLIDHEGRLVIPDVYDSLTDVSEGLVGAIKEDRGGYLDLNGHTVIPFDFKVVQEFRGGVAHVRTFDGFWRVINKSGRFLDELELFAVPDDLKQKYVAPKKGQEIACKRAQIRSWFNSLQGHVFKTLRESKVGYLIHYAAPYTGSDSTMVGKGTKFVLQQKMRDDAWYCSVVDSDLEQRVSEKECRMAGARNPRLAGRCKGVSFFVTEGQLSGRAFKEVYDCDSPRRLES